MINKSTFSCPPFQIFSPPENRWLLGSVVPSVKLTWLRTGSSRLCEHSRAVSCWRTPRRKRRTAPPKPGHRPRLPSRTSSPLELKTCTQTEDKRARASSDDLRTDGLSVEDRKNLNKSSGCKTKSHMTASAARAPHVYRKPEYSLHFCMNLYSSIKGLFW